MSIAPMSNNTGEGHVYRGNGRSGSVLPPTHGRIRRASHPPLLTTTSLSGLSIDCQSGTASISYDVLSMQASI